MFNSIFKIKKTVIKAIFWHNKTMTRFKRFFTLKKQLSCGGPMLYLDVWNNIPCSHTWERNVQKFTETLDHENLIPSSLSPSGRLFQSWSNSIEMFQRYHIRVICKNLATTLTTKPSDSTSPCCASHNYWGLEAFIRPHTGSQKTMVQHTVVQLNLHRGNNCWLTSNFSKKTNFTRYSVNWSFSFNGCY